MANIIKVQIILRIVCKISLTKHLPLEVCLRVKALD
jgi:hypothetical protein